jgi:hypothetical protein
MNCKEPHDIPKTEGAKRSAPCSFVIGLSLLSHSEAS